MIDLSNISEARDLEPMERIGISLMASTPEEAWRLIGILIVAICSVVSSTLPR